MPLIKRAVQPIELSRAHVAQGVRNELECVTNNTLANVIRQLSSLSKHAEDMFAELFGEANAVFSRANSLQERVNKLNVKVTQLDSTQDVVSLQDINMRKPFKSSVIREQQIISKRSRPRAIEETYLDCDAPPALSKLNTYREDGKDSIKFYTDATYFFELWCQQMQKDTEKDRKKGRKHRKGPRRDVPAQIRPAQNRMQDKQKYAKGKEFCETPNRSINVTHIEGNRLMDRPDNLPVSDRGSLPRSGDYVKPDSMYNNKYQAGQQTRTSQVPPHQHQQPGGGGMPASYGNGPVTGHVTEDSMGEMLNQSSHQQYNTNYGSPQSTSSRTSSRTSSVQSPMRPMSKPPPPPEDRGNLPPPPPPPPAFPGGGDSTPPPPLYPNTAASPQHHHHSLPDSLPGSRGSPAKSVDSLHGGYSRDSTPSSHLSDPLPPPPPSPPLSAGTPGSATDIPPPPPPPPGLINGPPPPPPPPPIANGPTPPAPGGGPTDLLESIRQGTTLKSTADMRPPSPELPDPRSDLLRAIQQGIQLRKIDRAEKHQQQRRNTAGHLDVQAIMEAAFEMRRQAMERDSSSEGESGDEDGGWSDEED